METCQQDKSIILKRRLADEIERQRMKCFPLPKKEATTGVGYHIYFDTDRDLKLVNLQEKKSVAG
ncbi:hypothetical protein HanPI659440_Chr00c02g0708911 [Helianthus annuus]|nr:hypothetical protein HanPI659440_Chr00c02g0708911 [Helianthus annuus]